MIVPKIKGNSGCELTVVEENGILRIIKTCKDSYRKRLYEQYVKQKNERDYLQTTNSFIKVPEIEWKDDFMNMSYIHGRSFIDFFERSNITDIVNITDNLISYIEDEVSRSEFKKINKNVLVDKIKSTFENTKNNKYYQQTDDDLFESVLSALEKINEYIYIPIGQCHGDLTFSNIIFNNSGIWFIDFLDSFVETPLQDIVKLRQDTLYKWSTKMTESSYNKTRINTVFKYIDDRIDKHFSNYEWYNSFYNIFQCINILRILPYTKSEEIHDFLVNILTELTHKIKL
jgi:thiamine kinase-like enzyme